MLAQLTSGERQLSIVVLILLTMVGLAMAAPSRGDPIGVHGFIVVVARLAMLFVMLSALYAPEPSAECLDRYYDDPSKVGVILTMIWAMVGTFIGVWVASLLAWPDLTFDAAWASFGRLRPVGAGRGHGHDRRAFRIPASNRRAIGQSLSSRSPLQRKRVLSASRLAAGARH